MKKRCNEKGPEMELVSPYFMRRSQWIIDLYVCQNRCLVNIG
jgi:hypothetical protein